MIAVGTLQGVGCNLKQSRECSKTKQIVRESTQTAVAQNEAEPNVPGLAHSTLHLKGSRLIKNLGVSGLFQDLESSEVICGVLQAAILDSCQQVLGLCTFRYGEYSNHNVVRVWRAYSASMPKP